MNEQINSPEPEETKNNSGIPEQGLKKDTENLIGQLRTASQNLKRIIMTSLKIKKIKESDIEFAKPILLQNDKAIIFPKSIVVIQGQAGVHKSRLAEIFCAALLKITGFFSELLEYTRGSLDDTYTIVYVDTERNLSEQFPYALQGIQMKAGYKKADHPENFKYISLLEIPRKERFAALNEYLAHLRVEKTKNPFFIVLDVCTDCIEDFNKTDKSMELIDLMNVAINEYNVVFLCLIHENPKSEKARGHLGSELMNKATTSIQVSFEKDSNNNDTELIKIKYLKCRSTARHTPIYAIYSDEQKGLILADENYIHDLVNAKKQKADMSVVKEYLEMYLGDGSQWLRRALLDKLCHELGASEKTIEERLKDLFQNKITMQNQNGKECLLEKDKSKKEIKYFFEVVKSESEN